MAELPNFPKLSAIIMMGISIVFVTIVVGFLFKKYAERRRTPALSLAFAFLLWDLGAISVFVFAILHYVLNPIAGEYQYTRYGINLGYAFSAMSNILLVFFISQIYSQSPMFRKTQKAIPIANSILNGVTIGLITDTIVYSFDPTIVEEAAKFNPEYPIGQTIYHLALTLIAFLMLLVLSAQSRKQALFRWEKAGFGFIIASAISGIFVYVFFALDLVVQETGLAIFADGYTVFNHLGWVSAMLMALFGYAGFVMPPRLRNWFQAKDKEAT
jgi:hypothetical protein